MPYEILELRRLVATLFPRRRGRFARPPFLGYLDRLARTGDAVILHGWVLSRGTPIDGLVTKRNVEEGETAGSPAYNAKLKAYEQREVMMRRQRLTPDFPPWPCTCFYPMNKKREVGENWFMLDFDARNRLMAEHGRTGMTFGGKVTQLITVGIGLEDWEWGVTLWARNPEFLKDIVYRMRFDEASARYAEFGPFYVSYVMKPDQVLEHCQVG